MKKALIIGITGQDGSYLAELLLNKNYEVHGIIRRSSTFSTKRIDHLYQEPHEEKRRLHLHYGDLTDSGCIHRLLHELEVNEVYNLGAQSHVKVSFENPIYTVNVTALGTLHLLEAIRSLPAKQRPKLYQASSSEMFGNAPAPQNEMTPFQPRSPYACAKVYAHHQTINYREAYGIFISNGILFNHESPRRGENFVSRKITRAAARIRMGLQSHLWLGNLDAKRDMGFAGDYVEAMWTMLQQERPDDYVIATGETYTIKEFLTAAFQKLDLDWQDHVKIDPRYFRPTEVDELRGDASKAREALGWYPKTSFNGLISMMVKHDMEIAQMEYLYS